MMRQFMQDVPKGIMEAAEVNGVRLWEMSWRTVIPLTRAGIMGADGAAVVILGWYELLFGVWFAATERKPLSVAFGAQQIPCGLSRTQASAFAAPAIAVPVTVGLATRMQPVRALTSGAITSSNVPVG